MRISSTSEIQKPPRVFRAIALGGLILSSPLALLALANDIYSILSPVAPIYNVVALDTVAILLRIGCELPLAGTLFAARRPWFALLWLAWKLPGYLIPVLGSASDITLAWWLFVSKLRPRLATQEDELHECGPQI